MRCIKSYTEFERITNYESNLIMVTHISRAPIFSACHIVVCDRYCTICSKCDSLLVICNMVDNVKYIVRDDFDLRNII